METKADSNVDPIEFINKYNSGVANMPLDYAFCRELLALLFSLLMVHPRRVLIKKLFSKVIETVSGSSDPFVLLQNLSKVILKDFLSDDDIRAFYFLSVPDGAPIDEESEVTNA